MILNGRSSFSFGACLDFKAKSKSYNTASLSIPSLPSKVAFTSIRSSWVPHQELKYPILRYRTPRGGIPHLKHVASSSPLMIGDLGVLLCAAPRKSGLCRTLNSPKALLKNFFPRWKPMTKKPMFWWRSIACVPYLMPLHQIWMYDKTAYHLHPFLEDLKYLSYPFFGRIRQLPKWFLTAYLLCVYLGVVKRKAWPHFFRFHVVVAMLLEIALQVTGYVSGWLPRGLYWGKIGMHTWTALAYGFLFTVLECMRCAILGMYADIPFISDAAYIQVP